MTFQSAGVTLKIRSRSPESNQQTLFSQQCIYASLIKVHGLVQKITHKTIFWTFQSASVTLKIRSRSPNSNLLFSSQQCIYAGLVKIHLLAQKIMHWNRKVDDVLTPTQTLKQTLTGSAPKTIYPPPSGLGGHKINSLFELWHLISNNVAFWHG